MKLPDYFSGLLDGTVNLSDDRLRQLDEHVAAIGDSLRADERLGPILRRFLRQGSWAQRTMIRPPAGREVGADVLVELKQQSRWADDPQQYLLALHQALAASPRYQSRAELGTRSVRVEYASDCRINLVPYLHTAGWSERHEIVNRAENSFEQVNPGGFSDWTRSRDQLASGHLRTTIRLLKYLRDDRQAFAAPSVILTVLAGGQVRWWRSQFLDGYGDLPTAFTRLVSATDRWLQQHPARPEIPDPSCAGARFEQRLTPDEYESFREQFHALADRIAAAFSAAGRDESVALWREVFGTEFAPV